MIADDCQRQLMGKIVSVTEDDAKRQVNCQRLERDYDTRLYTGTNIIKKLHFLVEKVHLMIRFPWNAMDSQRNRQTCTPVRDDNFARPLLSESTGY